MSFTVDNLTSAIAKGLTYPELNEHGNIDYNDLMSFLEKLCKIFKWEIYEKQTLGHVSKQGNHGLLRWYAVILSQWIKGTGLSFIIKEALEFKRQNPETCVWDNWKPVRYDDSLRHRNLVISDTLQVIENVILFSISNYFLRFSSEYKRFHNVESFPNDWYEYVEYGTTNPLSITLAFVKRKVYHPANLIVYHLKKKINRVLVNPDGCSSLIFFIHLPRSKSVRTQCLYDSLC
jgi:hypothetical protein